MMTFKHLGSNHPDLTLPLVITLLDIHPFFDTPEPDIEDPGMIFFAQGVLSLCLYDLNNRLDNILFIHIYSINFIQGMC